jgi:hypothetical protein
MALVENYLRDLLFEISRKAITAKKDRDHAVGSENHQFQTGHLMAYYEISSLIFEQAQVFGLDLKEFGIGDLNPERDLL